MRDRRSSKYLRAETLNSESDLSKRVTWFSDHVTRWPVNTEVNVSGGIKAGFRVRVATTIVWSRCFGSASATKGGKHGFTVGSVHHRRSAHCFNRSSVLFVHAEEKSDEGEKECGAELLKTVRYLPGIEGSLRLYYPGNCLNLFLSD